MFRVFSFIFNTSFSHYYLCHFTSALPGFVESVKLFLQLRLSKIWILNEGDTDICNVQLTNDAAWTNVAPYIVVDNNQFACLTLGTDRTYTGIFYFLHFSLKNNIVKWSIIALTYCLKNVCHMILVMFKLQLAWKIKNK